MKQSNRRDFAWLRRLVSSVRRWREHRRFLRENPGNMLIRADLSGAHHNPFSRTKAIPGEDQQP